MGRMKAVRCLAVLVFALGTGTVLGQAGAQTPPSAQTPAVRRPTTQKIGDQRVALIKDYAENYDKIDDTQADGYPFRVQ
jgi:hypothetical protein